MMDMDSGIRTGVAHLVNVGSTGALGMIEFEPGLERDLPEVLDHQAVPDPESLPTEPSDPLQEADLPEVNAPEMPAVLTRLQVSVLTSHLTKVGGFDQLF